MFKLGLEKAEEPEIKLPAFTGSQRKQENSRKTFISVSLTMLQPLTVWVITNCGIFLMRWEYQTCLLRNLYASQNATVRTGHGITDWFQTGKGVCQGCILSSCLFNLYAEHIRQNAGLDESQAVIRIAGRNMNNLRYADDSTLIAESKEEVKSLLMNVKKESEKAGLKLNIQKMKVIASDPITSRQVDGENVETVRFRFLGLQNQCGWWLQPCN